MQEHLPNELCTLTSSSHPTMRVSVPTLAKVAFKLPKYVIEEQLARLNLQLPTPHWDLKSTEDECHLEGNFKFKTFAKTWKFLNTVAIIAHNEKHHPTITTTYNEVQLQLTTHDSKNQVTTKDMNLAQTIHTAYAKTFVPTETPHTEFLKGARTKATMHQATRVIDELTRRLQ